MAHSLEVREPLMDHKLVEWLATLPSSEKIRGQEGKYLLKEIDGTLPAQRRAIPPQDGLLGTARPLVPRPPQTARAGIASSVHAWPTPAGSIVTTCSNWSTAHNNGSRDYSASIWTLLMFEAFLRNVMEQGEPA